MDGRAGRPLIGRTTEGVAPICRSGPFLSQVVKEDIYNDKKIIKVGIIKG
jgi:hypothetical protein